MRRKHFLLAVVLVLFCRSRSPAQISPGPLSHAHEQLEGVTHCSSCHDFGVRARSFKCLECHTEIQHRLEAHTGYHAHVYRSSPSQADCVRCHMEHNGQRFALVTLDRKSFDHAAETGFALQGKHRSLACGQCHAAKNIPSGVKPQIKLRDLNQSFLGLGRECLSCHEDAHRGQEGPECGRCHQQDSWKSAPGFAHARTSFPLTGLHQTVACEKCHMPRAEERAPLFKGLNYNGCQSCHTDPHRGAFKDVRFQGSCESCHNTGGWKNNHPSTGFDHNATRFKLVGKHAELACGRCHKDSDFHRPVAHERCSACHEDPHKRQFAARAAGSDCSACHNQTGFKPALFDREAHQHSAFPLDGKHSSVACADCHQPAGRDTVYITRKLICSACHMDQHAGQFASVPLENKCDACHTQAGFQPSTFSVERHAQTKFALTGGHTSVACGECHKPIALPIAVLGLAAPSRLTAGPPRQYHFASQTCNACHADPHQTALSCETCHTTEKWKVLRPFDHATTKFPLDGAHQKVACSECHRPAASGTVPKFPVPSSQCSACHAAKDVHEGQFRTGARQEDCARCHVTSEWTEKIFDHDKAHFALDVAHRNVTCEKCHKEQMGVAGKTIRVYRDTPAECVKCH